MEMRRLGSAGPEISVVGYGAWEAGGTDWGPNQSDDQVVASMRAVFECGMNWIDTAEVYGDGRSEELVAEAVKGRRDEILIFTKVAPRRSGSGFRRHEVNEAIRGSLKRLGTDRVDLYQLHWRDRSGVPVEETWEAMAELQDEGLVRWVGVSNFDRELIEQCEAIRHVDSVQNEFSLLRRRDATSLLPWLAHRGIGYLAYGPLAFGLLTGALTLDTRFEESDWRSGTEDDADANELFGPENFPRNLERVERLRPIAERLGTSIATLALRCVVDQTGVTAAIAGTRNPRHVVENARAGALQLNPTTLREIQEALDLARPPQPTGAGGGQKEKPPDTDRGQSS